MTATRRIQISKSINRLVFKRDKNRCVICGSTHNLTIDHVIPLSKGGSNNETNLMTLCSPCNRAKGNEIYTQFIRT